MHSIKLERVARSASVSACGVLHISQRAFVSAFSKVHSAQFHVSGSDGGGGGGGAAACAGETESAGDDGGVERCEDESECRAESCAEGTLNDEAAEEGAADCDCDGLPLMCVLLLCSGGMGGRRSNRVGVAG